MKYYYSLIIFVFGGLIGNIYSAYNTGQYNIDLINQEAQIRCDMEWLKTERIILKNPNYIKTLTFSASDVMTISPAYREQQIQLIQEAVERALKAHDKK